MKGLKMYRRVFSLSLGVVLFSILVYGVFYIKSKPTQAIPVPTPTPTATVTPTATATARPTPTPTGVPPAGEQLIIQTIPQEDQLREKGIMILCANGNSNCLDFPIEDTLHVRDLHAEYKIDIRLDGVNVHPDFFDCNIIEKEVCHIPPDVPKGEIPAGLTEATELFDVSDLFECILNDIDKTGDGFPDGVGVMEIFYLGNPDDARLIGDHIVKVEACVGRVCAAEIQDLCIMNFPTCGFFKDCTVDTKEPNYMFSIRWSDKREDTIWKFADPIFPFASCKNLGVWQRELAFPTGKTAVPDCVDILDDL